MWSYLVRRKFFLLQYFGVCYSLVVITALYVANVMVTCPALYGWVGCATPILIGTVIVLNTAVNLLLFQIFAKRNRADLHYKGLKGPTPQVSTSTIPSPSAVNNYTNASGLNFRPPSVPPPTNNNCEGISLTMSALTTKFCYTCKANFPTRVHHCSLCDYCVVRRDHHCFFTGGCVGFGNQRFFIGFLLWAALGAAMGAIFAGLYLNRFYRPFWPLGWINFIFPVTFVKFVFYLDDQLTYGNFFVALLFSVGYCSSWAAIGFFTVQLISIAKGQSLWDATQKINNTDDLTVGQRFKAVFGPYWAVNLLFPTPFPNKISYLRENYNVDAKEM